MKIHTPALALFAAALFLIFAGCDAADPAHDAEASATEDVAMSVSSLVSEDTGGLLDQVGDIFDLASAGGIEAQAEALAGKSAQTASPIEKTYDPATGTWTMVFTREYTSPDGLRQGTVHRVYAVQFLNADSVPQQFFVTEGDTAHSIDFTIVEGTGTLETPHLSATRADITGHFVATGVNTEEVTVNGTYGRSGAHTLTTGNAVRTLDYDLAVEVTDLVGPCGSRRDLSQKVSGTITGLYTATATFERGDLYRERDVERQIIIVIEDGEALITVNGETYAGDVQTGDVVGG